MGSYSKNLASRLRRGASIKKAKHTGERLVSAALIREGTCHHGARSHAELRGRLGDEDRYTSDPGDTEGFMTSSHRFVTRTEAVQIAIDADQLPDGFSRQLLSSDIRW